MSNKLNVNHIYIKELMFNPTRTLFHYTEIPQIINKAHFNIQHKIVNYIYTTIPGIVTSVY